MAEDLTQQLAGLGLGKSEFAGLLGVTPRAVSMWLSGEREVPGPVAAYVRLFGSIPQIMQAQELAKLSSEATPMLDGMFSLAFSGKDGDGAGVLVLDRGRIYGSDGSVRYDGKYKLSNRIGFLEVTLWLTVPPNALLVTGAVAVPFEYGFELVAEIAARGETRLNVFTPSGAVSAVVNFLREIPSELAA